MQAASPASPDPTVDLAPMLTPMATDRGDELARQFQHADPFRHVVIEDFFAPSALHDLLAQFPPFARGEARNEAGAVAGKATVEKIRRLGEAYRDLDELVQSPPFLAWIGAITGIPDLLYDPYYFGGGTHENRHGQELDPHIDFNRHPVEGWHRRLNLIVYLNPDWAPDWGGALELHSDPRGADDRIVTIAPEMNRAVIFETTEASWHGFSRIVLPEGQRATVSRRSIALYFYTRERPAAELGPTHATVYVDRPLPERFVAGRVLSAHDTDELHALLARRDQHNQRLYHDLQQLQGRLDEANAVLRAGPIGRLYRLARQLLARLRK